MSTDKQLPTSASVVIIGGGVGGASIAYHLAELGQRDVVLVDRDELTSGSTFHSAGLVGQLRADPTLTRMNMYSVELYRTLQQTDFAPAWVESGGIKLASTPERMEEIRRQISWSRTFDLGLEEISAEQAQELFPLMDTKGIVGAAYLPSDGYIDPSQLCYALANLARRNGVKIHTHTRVLGIDAEKGRVSRVRTDRGDIECETVVNCGGMFAAEIGRMVGVRIPLIPMSHQYLVTEAFLPRRERPLPTLRDPDLLVYYRQEVDGLVMGGYERDAEPWTADANSYDNIPADFNGRLLPDNWARLEEITENSQIRVPAMGDVGLRKLINGPEAFTPDNEFCLGETEVDGFFVAAGFCAHGIAGAGGIGKVMAEWVVEGEPSLDVWHMDIRRFGRQYRSPSYTLKRTLETYQTYYDIKYPNHERSAGRPLRMSPAYPWHAAHEAFFGEKSGWERVNYYRSNADHGDESLRPRGWAGRNWSPAIGVEHVATRTTAALFDETSFAKIEVSGPDAADLLEWVCDNRVAREVGSVTYTQALNKRGGIEADFTVTRTADDSFLVVTGTAFGSHDLAWLRRQARRRSADVRITDVTGQYVCYGLWGPRSREILSRLTPADLSNGAFPFMTAQDVAVGDVPARALRVTFTGELGWEIYAPGEYGAGLWTALWEAGQDLGLVAAGYRAIDSLRLEKGYRVWSTDVTPETNPYEAGLGFCVKLDKPGGFLGADALRAAKEAGVTRRLRCITLDDPRSIALGSEPVRVGDKVVGRVTSGGYGYTVGSSIAYAYLPTAEAEPGSKVSIDIFGQWVDGVVAPDPLFDPRSTRVRLDVGEQPASR
ncbi:MAG: FAD-dependent oxidoreductase [Dactylosporangium sp.]|jgi:glycine cleavage system aminomethyltransferase T/glycine/D-amino acid oxidase-like deaminating enzyme|nr:FAD-dependent oxidoreductase [Dactylosporangium sp.]